VSSVIRIVAGVLLSVVVLFLITLALPVEAWRRGEPGGPRFQTAAVAPPWPRPLRLWVDTDAACGLGPRTDPDDCFALLLLARSPEEVELVGISTVFGNGILEATDSITRALAGRLPPVGHRGPNVFRGAARPLEDSAGSDGLIAPAYRALERALEEGPLVLLALGPLTNLATVLRGRPDLRTRVIRIVAVMGRRRGHLFHPVEGQRAPSILGHGPVFRDFNFAKDPEAALALLGMRLPLTLVPYEAAREITLTEADLNHVGAASDAGRWVAQRARGWLSYWERDIGRAGFYPFDLVAAGYVVRPEMAGCAPALAWIGRDSGILGWLGRRGLFVRPPEGPPATGETAPARYCPDLAEHGSDWLVARLTAERRPVSGGALEEQKPRAEAAFTPFISNSAAE
jgi:purine nucleosidase